MSPELARKLISKGIIHQNTEIDAFYRGVDISGAAVLRSQGNFTVLGAKVVGEKLYFDAVSTNDGVTRRILCEDIFKIDGMEPDRVAINFGLTDIGVDVVQGKRRGRKPKPRQPV